MFHVSIRGCLFRQPFFKSYSKNCMKRNKNKQMNEQIIKVGISKTYTPKPMPTNPEFVTDADLKAWGNIGDLPAERGKQNNFNVRRVKGRY